MSVLMPFQTLSVPSHGCSVLMSTDWLTVRVPPAAGLAAAGAWVAGTAVGWTTAWVGIGAEVGGAAAGFAASGGLAGARVPAGAGAWPQPASIDVPTVAASPSAARARNPRRVSESAGRVCIVNASDPDQPDLSGLSNRVNPCAQARVTPATRPAATPDPRREVSAVYAR